MIDTIVVFDRVRENRGKFGALDKKVINDSINQTLSRTLLTAGSTMVTLTVMYFSGGPGIHGFTFILLFGIFIGTYSSIAIASPILLIFGKTEAAMGNRPTGALQRA
jgi:preprotein translocase subunit SecF